LWLSPHHRHDLIESSCVNKEIVVFNRKLYKLFKNADTVEIIQANITRNDYTRHGMHLRISGKEKVSKSIVDSIKETMSGIEETPSYYIIIPFTQLNSITSSLRIKSCKFYMGLAHLHYAILS
jgi:hypothetical protein